MKDLITFIKKNSIGSYKEDVKLEKNTTYKVGGVASLFVYPKNTDKLIILLDKLNKEGIKHKVLGFGSNVIFSDKRYDGVIIKLDNFNDVKIKDTTVVAGAGVSLVKLSYKAQKEGLTGLEFASGIPGSVGGAVFMNAGAYKKDMSSIVRKVKVLTPELEIKTLFNNNLQFAYRDSFFKHNKGYIILEVTLKLVKKNEMEILNLMKERKLKRIETQPLNYPSAGSVFRNPDNGYAGSLIEQSNLKGYHINGATVSTKHANFIVNKGSCSGEDIVKLINHIKKTIKDNYNIDLILEQIIINGDYSE